jgi:hypothetical protein
MFMRFKPLLGLSAARRPTRLELTHSAEFVEARVLRGATSKPAKS